MADSATPLCADAANFISCADAADAGVGGQDGESVHGSPYQQPAPDLTFDPVTGLVWQASTDVAEDGGGYTWSEASALCGGLDAGSLHDWRLPSTAELLSIDDLGKYPKAYNEAFFTFAFSDWMTWTSSPAPASGKAMRVTFYNGEVVPDPETARHPVRCVRGGQCQTATRFVTSNGITYDRLTDLSWQSAWPTPTDWVSALAYCRDLQLGGASWRLATVHELASLLDYSLSGPLLDATAFQPRSSPSTLYGGNTAWSSSPVGQTSPGGESWFVNFDNGSIYRDVRTDALNVACVHAGP